MRRTKVYLGGEDIDENEMMPGDLTDFLVSFIKDIFGGRR